MIQLSVELINKIENSIDLGYISKQKHSEADLWILNYTKKAQYEWAWTPSTTICRGLIVDSSWNIVARAYPKFMSYEQIVDKSEIPMGEVVQVYDKADGSLGVMYFIDGVPFVATRGSFKSEMADEANKMLTELYGKVKWNPRYSYVFEIIYPENRIVVDYGDKRELVLHGIYDNETGEEIPLHEFVDLEYLRNMGVPIIKQYDVGVNLDGFDRLIETYPYDGREGFVVRFESGYRVKIKYDEYKNLSYVIEQTSPKRLLDMIENGAINDILDQLPEIDRARVVEFERKVKDRFDDIHRKYIKAYEDIQLALFAISPEAAKNEKWWAQEINAIKKEYNPAILFAIMKHNHVKVKTYIWKMVKNEAIEWEKTGGKNE